MTAPIQQPQCSVAILSPPFSPLSYSIPAYFPFQEPPIGLRVLVPLGKSVRMGVVVPPTSKHPAESDKYELKPLLWPVEREPLLDAEYMDLIRELSVRQMEPTGRILGIVLPLGLRTSQLRFNVYGKGRPRTYTPKALGQALQADADEMLQTWRSGNMEVSLSRTQDAENEYHTVNQDPPWPVRPAAKRQIQLLEFIWSNGPTPKSFLLKEFGTRFTQAVKPLVERGLVRIGPRPSGYDDEADDVESIEVCGFEWTDEQRTVIQAVGEDLVCSEGKMRLIHGITGSGKTAVYMEAAAMCLEQGRSVLLLAPEVALALSLRKAARKYFPGRTVRLYHGYLTPAERMKIFSETAASRQPELIVGTRSALFLPVRNLGLVVLDEEHDASFKQDERLGYRAKEIAYHRTLRSKGVLMLGSATPDVKSYYAAGQGAMPLNTMQHRIGRSMLPTVELVDIRGSAPTEQLLARETTKQLIHTVKQGNQAVILLNRRGYSPLMFCMDCEKTATCPQCEIAFTYHKARERLVCHYCGESLPFPLICGNCGGSHWLPMGEGTERLEETLETALPPDTAIARLDKDSTRRPGRMEAVLEGFRRGEAQVLVGTQMISKGHHFPNVTLVVIADGDLGRNLPDYRAAERTFQLLVQSSGRAGRGETPGSVLIQTRDPENPFWRFVRNNDYLGFYHLELDFRKRRKYPPFVKLGLIRLSFPLKESEGMRYIGESARLLRQAAKDSAVTVLGPAPAPLSLLRGFKRFHCLVKASNWVDIRRVYCDLCNGISSKSVLRTELDLDPENML